MKLINKYILKQLVLGFVLVLVSMVVLIWLMQSLRLIDMIVTKGVSVGIFLKMTFFVLPNFIQILSPLALFAVVLFVYVRMQSDKELMVMRAAGMDNLQLMQAALIFAGFLTVVGYGLTLYLIPQSNIELRQMKWKVRNNLSHLLLQEGQFNSFKDGLTIYVKERLGDGQVKGVLVYENKGNGKASTMIAQDGVVFQENDEMQVVLHEGIRQEVESATQKFSVLKFDKYTMVFNENKPNRAGQIGDARELPLKTLLTTSKTDRITPQNYRKYKVEALKRIIQPIYNFTFVFVALCGVLIGFYNRRGQMAQINMAVGAAIVIQSLALAFENMSGKNLIFMPLMVLNAFLPILAVYWVLIKGKRIRLPWVSAVVLLSILSVCLPVEAAAPFKIKEPEISKEKPVDFESDTVSYDQTTGMVIASGNVVISQNGTVMRTKKIMYDRQNNMIISTDPVETTLPDGTVTVTDNLSVSGDMKQAVADGIEMRLYEGSLIKSSKLKRTNNGQNLYLKEVVYTPCDRCEGKDPLWQLRAKRMKHDGVDKTIEYYHSFLDVEGVPVFYFPYFSMPDFSIKRKTGLLTPTFGSGRDLGTSIGLPLFIDIADNQNLLITPVISFSHTPLGMVEYDGLFKKGKVHIDTSGTQDDDSNAEGHIRAGFTYDANKNWRLNGQFFRVSNDTYFRRYVLPDIDDQQPFLYSNLTAERFAHNSYLSVGVLGFQDLRTQHSKSAVKTVLPTFDFMYQTNPFWGNMYAFSNINSAFVRADHSLSSDRISIEQGIRMPYASSWGLTSDLIASVRGDGYYVDTGADGFLNRRPDDSYSWGRLYPNVSLELNYPMTSVSENISQTFEPIVMAVWSTNSGNSDKIPNFDSLDFDFDDTNLFSRNRFSGYDRVETGARVNYGARWSLFDSAGHSISALFGQSYRLREDDGLNGLMGMDDRFSDYVGRLQVDYGDLSVAYRFRLAQDNFSPLKNEVTLEGGRDPLRLGIDYLYLKPMRFGDFYYDKREEFLIYGSSKFSKQWSGTAFYRYDLAGNGPLEGGFTVRYDNECLAVLLELQKSYAEDKDYKGDTSVMLKFILKTLGGS